MNRAHSFSDRTGEMIVYGVEESKEEPCARTTFALTWQYCLARLARARERWQIYITRGRQIIEINQSISGGLQVLSDVDVCEC